MNCWDRFDRKVVLCFTGLKARAPKIVEETDRVGVNGLDVQWQFPSPLDKTLLRGMRHIGVLDAKIGYFNSSMGHYSAIARSYHLGCQSVLVMEDDVRFLKDTAQISQALASIPADYDVALIDSFFKHWEKDAVNADVMAKWREERAANKWWAEFDSLYSLGCYALSRRGMERMMFAFEAVETKPSIGKMRIADHFLSRKVLGEDSRLYFARKNIAIQREMGAANSPTSDIRKKYEAMGLDLSEYAEA